MPRFLLWEMDVAIWFIFFCGVGIVFNFFFSGVCLGIGASWGYSKLKSGKQEGFLAHICYWNLPGGFTLRRAPPSAKRVFYG